MQYKAMAEITAKRRTIRKFTDEPVSRTDLEKIVHIGMQAPSGFNGQMWEVVVVDDPELRDEITQYIFEGIGTGKTSKGFKSAPAFIFMYGDERIREYGPAHLNENDAWWDFTLNTSLANSFMSMQLAAASLDLATMWVSAFRNPAVDGRTRKLLGIPDHLKVWEMMAVGHPKIKAGKKKMREMNDVLHYNRAENYRTKEDLDAWF